MGYLYLFYTNTGTCLWNFVLNVSVCLVKVQRAVFRCVPIDSVLVTQLKSCFSYVAASMYHSDVWHWQLSATSSEMYEICLIVAFSLPSVL